MDRQPAVILKHPSYAANLEPVCDASGREVAPAQAQPTARPSGPWDANCAPHPYALRQDVCIQCGHLVDRHWSIGGVHVGCDGAKRQGSPPRNPERWNDPRPGVSLAVLRAMHEQCGPALDIFLNGFTHDERLAMAHALAMVAVSAYLLELAK